MKTFQEKYWDLLNEVEEFVKNRIQTKGKLVLNYEETLYLEDDNIMVKVDDSVTGIEYHEWSKWFCGRETIKVADSILKTLE